MHGDATLFAREDYVEEAWRIVDPVLKAGTPVYEYEPGTWGPKEVDSRVSPPRRLAEPDGESCHEDRSSGRCRCGRARRAPHSPPRRRVRPSPRAVASSWPSAGVTPRGRCCVRWPMKTCRGPVCTSSRWTSAWRRPDDPDRNLTHLRESLLAHCPLRPEQIHAMPVESADLEAASGEYAATLQRDCRRSRGARSRPSGPRARRPHRVAGAGGSGARVTDADVALTGLYQGRRRMTLTYPMLNRSRRIVWLVTGREKAEMLARLCAADRSIPAGRIRQDQAVVLADHEAAARLGR